jgi:uncharacterized PurR-regulated membrane protein YhhQ (DUF165 family)
MNARTIAATASAASLVGAVIAANYITTRFGMVPVGFGLLATAGTYLAGLTFILRDVLQDTAGKAATLAVIAAGALVSFLVSDPLIAMASAAAFGISEIADLVVYTPLRKRGYIRAAVVSNVVGAFLDTVVFLGLAGFHVLAALPGQMVGKMIITALAVALVVGYRASRRAVTA